MDEDFIFLKKYIDNEIQNKLEELILTRRDLATIRENVISILDTTKKILINAENQSQLLGKIVSIYSETTKRIFQQFKDLREVVSRVENNSIAISNKLNMLLGDLDSTRENLIALLSDLKNDANGIIMQMAKIRDVNSEIRENLLSTMKTISEVNNTLHQEGQKVKSLLIEINETSNDIRKMVDNANTTLVELSQNIREVSRALSIIIETQGNITEALNRLAEGQQGIVSMLNKIFSLLQQVSSNQEIMTKITKKHDSELADLAQKVDKLISRVNALEDALRKEEDSEHVEETSA